MKPILIITLLVVSAFAHSAPPYKSGKDMSGNKIAWIGKGMDAVKQKLKDPESAQFRELYFHETDTTPPVTCGEVNSKNSLGGYTGYQRFLSAGKAELTFVESEVSDFQTAWDQFCE